MKIDELIVQFKEATDAVALRIEALLTDIKNTRTDLTPAQEAEGTAIVAHLRALGSDAKEPIPGPPPPVPPSA